MNNLNKPELATACVEASADSACPTVDVSCPAASVSLLEMCETMEIGLKEGSDSVATESALGETAVVDFIGTSVPKEAVKDGSNGWEALVSPGLDVFVGGVCTEFKKNRTKSKEQNRSY